MISSRASDSSLVRRCASPGARGRGGSALGRLDPDGADAVFPFQHAVNAIAGVLLGPWWAPVRQW
jgi:hypothetical protein